MKHFHFALTFLLGLTILFGACKNDDKLTPKDCNESMDGNITIHTGSFSLDLKVTGSGTYSISQIEYLDKTGAAKTVDNPSLPWEITITYMGPNGSIYPYRLSVNSTVISGIISATVNGDDGITSISQIRECSQSN